MVWWENILRKLQNKKNSEVIIRLMDWWVAEWMDGWMDGWTTNWLDGQLMGMGEYQKDRHSNEGKGLKHKWYES